MASFRPKEDEDFAWNAIKRAATAEIDLELKSIREERVDAALRELWPAFLAGLNSGQVKTANPNYKAWVRDALARVNATTGE